MTVNLVLPKTNHGLAMLTLISFIASFLAARTFTTITPTTVVVTGGIHFHHFWYGLAMIVSAGWLGIATYHPRLTRIYAVVFGLGAGLVGDEVGLLLTFGNYYSELTFVFFVGIVTFSAMGFLFLRYKRQLEHDFLSLGSGERTVHLGIFIMGISFVWFALGNLTWGLTTLLAGLVILVIGEAIHRRRAAAKAYQQATATAGP
jgi:hypothetical protein